MTIVPPLVGRHGVVPAPLRRGLRPGPRPHRHGQRRLPGEPVGRAGRPGVRPRGTATAGGSRASPATYLDARLRAQKLVAHLLPVRRVPVGGGGAPSCSAPAPRSIVATARSPPASSSPSCSTSTSSSRRSSSCRRCSTPTSRRPRRARPDRASCCRRPTLTPAAADPVPIRRPARRARSRFATSTSRYPTAPDDEALRGVDLRSSRARRWRFVGETGAGKSTLVKLVARFYDRPSGAVRVDGVDVRDARPRRATAASSASSPRRRSCSPGTVARQHRLRPARRHRRRGRGGRPGRRRPRGGGRGSRRLPRRHRRAGPVAVGRAAPADRARPGPALVDPAILLLDEATSQPRPGHRGAVNRAMGVVAEAGHDDPDRPPAADGRRRRPDRGDGRRRVVEVGQPPRAARRRGHYAQSWAAFEDRRPRPGLGDRRRLTPTRSDRRCGHQTTVRCISTNSRRIRPASGG